MCLLLHGRHKNLAGNMYAVELLQHRVVHIRDLNFPPAPMYFFIFPAMFILYITLQYLYLHSRVQSMLIRYLTISRRRRDDYKTIFTEPKAR